MRVSLALLFVPLLAGCPSSSGSRGDPGPKGDIGATGETGAIGPQGPKGDTGATGPNGTTGTAGAQGPTGQQGVQGPAGAVLVLDGGVVTGPPGSSVLVTPITAGGVPCAGGGVRVTQLSDGGTTNLCNGTDGATGPTGATGAMGAPGATGAAGSTGPAGAAGTPGAAGAAGPTGTQGPQGPPGPPGAVLYVDGGILLYSGSSSAGRHAFVGYTTFTGNGALGGRIQANGFCAAQFAASHLCNDFEYREARTGVPLGAAAAWLEFGGSAGEAYNDSYCTKWTTNSASQSGSVVLPTGYTTSSPVGLTCASVLPLACCTGGLARFRGFTAFTTNGNIGGRTQANARCATEFVGAHLCNDFEYRESRSSATLPAAGAWLEFGGSAGEAYNDSYCTKWTTASSAQSGSVVLPTGYTTSSPVGLSCASVLPLACCD